MRGTTVHIRGLVCAVALAVTLVAPTVVRAQPGVLSGKITYIGVTTLTIQSGGRQIGVVNALTRAATAVGRQEMPYVWGGGHGAAGVPSIGEPGGTGFNGHRIGYDCSGAVAAVLAGAGLWPAGSWVPNDAGVIRQLLADGVIAPGVGRTPDEVTLYDNPGVHIFMNIDGRFFGTSDGRAGANSKGGPGWLDDGAPDAFSPRFKRYHIRPAVLHDRTTYGHTYTFQIDPFSTLVQGAEVGDPVQIGYAPVRPGIMLARTITYIGALTATGTVVAVAPDYSSVTIETPAGTTMTFATSLVASLVSALAPGEAVQVSYAEDAGGALIPHAVTVPSASASP